MHAPFKPIDTHALTATARAVAESTSAGRSLRLLAAAVACATCSMAAQAGVIIAASPGFLFTAPGFTSGGDFCCAMSANNPNTVVGTSTLAGPPLPVAVGFFTTSLVNLETEYDFAWTITNSFSTSITGMSFTFTGLGFMRFDGGPSGTVLTSVPTSTPSGTLMSWTPLQIDFNFSGGLGSGQSATFHLPLDVLSGAADFAFQTVVGTPRLAAIPEPDTVLMLGTSLLALAVPWRRRRAGQLP